MVLGKIQKFLRKFKQNIREKKKGNKKIEEN